MKMRVIHASGLARNTSLAPKCVLTGESSSKMRNRMKIAHIVPVRRMMTAKTGFSIASLAGAAVPRS